MTPTSDAMPVLIKPQIKTGIFLSLISVVVIILSSTGSNYPASAFGAENIVGTANGRFYIRADNASLRTVADALYSRFDIRIGGLETHEHSKVNLAFEAHSLEELVKGLLRHMKINNYAFEFTDQQLKLVNIFPASKQADLPSVSSRTPSSPNEETVTVVVVKSVVESSQAEGLGILPGDLIVEYDGIRLNNAVELVKEVKRKSTKSSIDLLVVRNDSTMRLVVQGGFIGVRIATERISKSTYLDFF